MSNPELYQITLPSGTTYDLKDAVAREDIADIRNAMAGGVNFIGATTTALSDGSTLSTVSINGNNHAAQKGDLVANAGKEFLWDGTKWIEFGYIGAFKALAYKDSASGSLTPAGTVSQPDFTGEEMTATASYTPAGNVTVSVGSGTANYTPAGTVSKPDITVTPSNTSVYSITDVGTLPSLSMTVLNENLTISFSAGTLPTKGTAQSVMTGASAALQAAPTFSGTGVNLTAAFSGTPGTINAKGTPSGTVSQPTFTGTGTTVTVS